MRAARMREPATLSPPTLQDRPRRSRPALATRGMLIGRYVVIDQLGAGGMGVVYAAYDPELDRRVALKVMKPRGDGSSGHARMLREAQVLARLSHPNVVAVHDVVCAGDAVFIAMELVEGKTLSAWLRGGERDWQEIVRAFIAAGEGLAAAHAAGVIHRDFKPCNVLVGNDGRVRVVDFGLAGTGKDSRESRDGIGSSRALVEDLTISGTILGTPRFIPPEAYRSGHTDAASDQFSFCVALYEALYGCSPFPDDDRPTDDAHWVVRTPPRMRGVPRWVHRLVMRGLAKEARDRHASIATLVEALGRDPTRRRVIVAGVVAAALAGAGVLEQLRSLGSL